MGDDQKALQIKWDMTLIRALKQKYFVKRVVSVKLRHGITRVCLLMCIIGNRKRKTFE